MAVLSGSRPSRLDFAGTADLVEGLPTRVAAKVGGASPKVVAKDIGISVATLVRLMAGPVKDQKVSTVLAALRWLGRVHG